MSQRYTIKLGTLEHETTEKQNTGGRTENRGENRYTTEQWSTEGSTTDQVLLMCKDDILTR